MTTPTANRLDAIQPFHVMALLARARELEATGRSIIHMEVGEPDFDSPGPVVQAGIRALQQGKTRYTPAVGLRELRECVAGYYRDRFGVHVDPGRILITPGASGALQLIMALLVEPGSQVLMTDPGYPCNRNFVYLFEGEPVAVPVGVEERYQLNSGLLQRHWGEKTVCALIASPSNPTGTMLSAEPLRELVAAAAAKGGHLVVDEIYQGLSYTDRPTTALEFSDDVFVLNSFSKYFGMTGWRLGWLVAPERYVEDLDKLAQNLFLAAPTPAQYAALAAFEPETERILEQRRDEFRRRRDFLLPALRELGFGIPVEPDGAFYLYADAGRFTDDSYRFCIELLEKAGVAITPGIDFGEHRAARHVRFAYTTSVEKMQEGLDRIRDFVRDL